MRTETLLNHMFHFKGFVIGGCELDRDADRLDVTVRERSGTRVACPSCGRRCRVYDHLEARRYQAVPLHFISVSLVYSPRRADCPACGVHAERVPWAAGKSPLTEGFAWFLAGWARRLPWARVAAIFGAGWGQVRGAVGHAVEWGLAHRDVSGVTAVGIDEVFFGAKSGYRTLVYDLGGARARLLAVAPGHGEKSVDEALGAFGEAWRAGVLHVCSDMWRAYLKGARKWLPNAMHILDRFHIEKLLNEAVDRVRRAEAAELAGKGIAVLRNMRYVFLKHPENLTDRQREAAQGVMHRRRMKTVRAYGWKESFRPFWQYSSPFHARRFLRKWCAGASRSRLAPVVSFVGTARSHEELILNWFRAKKRFSSAAVEAMNRGAGLVSALARGYRNPEIMRIALFHALGDLPTPPEFTHRFS
jgi:Transposase and inactivated derivatives